MAPSSVDLVNLGYVNGAMEFQQTGFSPTVPTPRHPQSGEPSHQQHRPQTPSQPRTGSYHSQQLQPQTYQHQHQQQLSGDSISPHHVSVENIASQQQHHQYAYLDNLANMTNPRPSASASDSSHNQAVQQPDESNAQTAGDPQFDIFEWYPKYQSCQRYFVDRAQHSGHVHAVAAFVNIALPCQRILNPISGSPPPHSPSLAAPPTPPPRQIATSVSMIPYIRRLVVTGLDFPGVLHGFFGDDWVAGVGPLHEQERRNYLFAAKSGGWASVKKDYDMLPLETVPFMRPLQGPLIAEIEAAEKSWSEWLAMEDWMVGPRAPENMTHPHSGHERSHVGRQ